MIQPLFGRIDSFKEMVTIFKKFKFWKKFTRILVLGLCLMVILAAFKSDSNGGVLADYNCPAPTGTATNLTADGHPSGFQFPAGTRSVTLSWTAAPQAQAYIVVVRSPQGGQVVFSDDNYVSTTLSLQNLVDGASYHLSLRAKNNCEWGNTLGEATFSVAAALSTTCTNPPIFCSDGGDEGGGTYVNPDPNNNCQTVCPGQTAGQLTCNISQNLIGPYNNGYQYSLTGTPTSSYTGSLTYGWDLTNDGSIDRSDGSVINQSFYGNTTTRLHITDSANNFGDCYTNINLPNTQSPGTGTQYPVCNNLTANPSSGVSPLFVNFDAFAYSPANRSLSYQWDFGDGNNSGFSGRFANHTYSGSYPFNTSYNVRVHVIDSAGLATDCNTTVTLLSSQSGDCRSITCPVAPAGCQYLGQITSSCDPNVTLTCGRMDCPNGPNPFPPAVPIGSGIIILNNNPSSSTSYSSSTSSSSNTNNINIK